MCYANLNLSHYLPLLYVCEKFENRLLSVDSRIVLNWSLNYWVVNCMLVCWNKFHGIQSFGTASESFLCSSCLKLNSSFLNVKWSHLYCLWYLVKRQKLTSLINSYTLYSSYIWMEFCKSSCDTPYMHWHTLPCWLDYPTAKLHFFNVVVCIHDTGARFYITKNNYRLSYVGLGLKLIKIVMGFIAMISLWQFLKCYQWFCLFLLRAMNVGLSCLEMGS